ncbi:MAG: leucine-rich repeat domain-containing protein, partial [Clostridia bacterium]|nr:leucine-rich repeat domain-containing protein [Clostridia bacterium]
WKNQDAGNWKTVAIGDSVTKIGSAVFKGCEGLTEITVSNENTSYQSIDGNLYSKDGKIFIQYALGKNGAFVLPDTVKEIALSAFEGSITLTKVTIGNSVSKIGNYAFKGCTALTEVVIGNGVKEIGYWAFDGCVTLTTLAYQGTKSKWNAITKGSFWNQGVPATIVRCENGEIEL